jgi:hypothetical protein
MLKKVINAFYFLRVETKSNLAYLDSEAAITVGLDHKRNENERGSGRIACELLIEFFPFAQSRSFY